MVPQTNSIANLTLTVGIDVAKYQHVALAKLPNSTIKKLSFSNDSKGFLLFKKSFLELGYQVEVALEPTGDYHRALGYFLLQNNVSVKFVNTVAMARMRDALNNSWNKNDPRDAQVILHMLNNKITQTYHEPSINNVSGIQELAALHFRLSRTKTKIQHTILNHYLPLYFPEGKKYFTGGRVRWFTRFLRHFPVPKSALKYSLEEFIENAWNYLDHVPFRKKILTDFYETCQTTIGIPIEEESLEAKSFQQTLEDHNHLTERLKKIETSVDTIFKDDTQYPILRSIPGIGPIIALNIIAESGNIKRFYHSRQYIKYMGLNLCSSQSGMHQGQRRIGKRGNSRLRSVLWMATKAAIFSASQGNSFKKKYLNIASTSLENGDIKRKALTACTIKMATIIHTLIKNNTPFRPQYSDLNQAGKLVE